MTQHQTPEQIAAFLKILGDCAREAAENENPNLEAAFDQIAALVRRPSIRPDGEMVERAAIRLCALDLGNEGFWKTIGEEDRNTYRDEARDVLTAALAVQPGSGWRVPEGWKLVPEEPSNEMLDASWKQSGESKDMRLRYSARMRKHWEIMLSAAPLPPVMNDNERKSA